MCRGSPFPIDGPKQDALRDELGKIDSMETLISWLENLDDQFHKYFRDEYAVQKRREDDEAKRRAANEANPYARQFNSSSTRSRRA